MKAAVQQRYFTEQLLHWHQEENNRQLPWKNEKNPYKIWLSEIILQQTRAEQGLPYYHKFIAQYPDVYSLANAPDEAVFLLWQGLGYYSRCRNLLKAARIISQQYDGKFPDKFEEIIALPGVGNYTASAIASFGFGQPYAVVDGNVYRVLSRFFGIDTPIDSTSGKKEFATLAAELLDQYQPAAYNQAIMDFGASICKPQVPLCNVCYLAEKCVAYKKDLIALLPVKEKKLKVKERHFHYFLLEYKDEIFISLRKEKDIWQDLHEPYLIETEGNYKAQPEWTFISESLASEPAKIYTSRQRLTHQIIHSTFYRVAIQHKSAALKEKGIWLQKNKLKNYAFPKTIISFFNGNEYF